MTEPKFTTTIAISVYYRAGECLPLVLESILKDPLDPKTIEIFVCDDCCPTPREEIEAIIAKYADRFGKIEYIRLEEKIGFRKTFLLQTVLDRCDSSIFVLLDGDCVLTDRALSRMLRDARRNDALCQGQRVFLYSSSIDWANKNLTSITDFSILKETFFVENTKTRKNRQRHRECLKRQRAGLPGRYDLASGYLMALKTVLAKKAGFTTHIGRGYMEDTDFAKRLFETMGVDVSEVMNAEVLHLFEHH